MFFNLRPTGYDKLTEKVSAKFFFVRTSKKQTHFQLLTVGFPCQLLYHLWLELAVGFTHDLQLSSTPPNPRWHVSPVTTSSPVCSSVKTRKRSGASLGAKTRVR